MRYIVGVMGPAKARKKDVDNARVLGELIARREWVVLTGGRDVGVMDAACQGAKKVPGSLLAALVAGKAPSWLHPVAGKPDNIEVYTIAVEPPQ